MVVLCLYTEAKVPRSQIEQLKKAAFRSCDLSSLQRPSSIANGVPEQWRLGAPAGLRRRLCEAAGAHRNRMSHLCTQRARAGDAPRPHGVREDPPRPRPTAASDRKFVLRPPCATETPRICAGVTTGPRAMQSGQGAGQRHHHHPRRGGRCRVAAQRSNQRRRSDTAARTHTGARACTRARSRTRRHAAPACAWYP